MEADNEVLDSQMKWLPSLSIEKSEVKKKWPGPVTFDEERNHVRLILSIPQLKKKRLFRRHDGNDVQVMYKFTQMSVMAEVTVKSTNDDGKPLVILYTYNKNLPEDIDPEKSTKHIEDGRLILKLFKRVPNSWAPHCQYFMERPEDVPI